MSIPRQNPILDPIVEEQNFVNFGSRPPIPFLQPLGNPRDRQDIIDPSGYDVSTPTYADASFPTEIPTAQAVPKFEIPGQPPFQGMIQNAEVNQLDQQTQEELNYTLRNRGRPFTSLVQLERDALIMYLIHKDDKRSQQSFTPEDKAQYSSGRDVFRNKSRNPEVIRIINEVEFNMGRDKKI
jgi:hypothetical protein